MHEMKTRGGRGVIAAVAVTAAIAIACSPIAASQSASSKPDGNGATASASQSAGASPSEMAIPSPSAVDAATSALNGVYRWKLTKADALAHGLPENKTPEALAQLPSIGNRTLKDGTWTGDSDPNGNGGTYTVDGNRLTFNWGCCVLTFTFVRDANGDLHLTPVLPMDPGDQWVWSTEPWTKIQ